MVDEQDALPCDAARCLGRGLMLSATWGNRDQWRAQSHNQVLTRSCAIVEMYVKLIHMYVWYGGDFHCHSRLVSMWIMNWWADDALLIINTHVMCITSSNDKPLVRSCFWKLCVITLGGSLNHSFLYGVYTSVQSAFASVY